MKDLPFTQSYLTLVFFKCCSLCYGGQHMTCNRTYYKKIECFRRFPNFRGIRLFGTLVMTDRDANSPRYGGQEIDWNNWKNYKHGFACRCMERLLQLANKNKKKYHHFTIANYAECWTSEDIVYNLSILGLHYTCVGDDYSPCRLEAESECVGAGESQMLYHVRYEDDPEENELKLPHSQCFIETLTVCSQPSSHTMKP